MPVHTGLLRNTSMTGTAGAITKAIGSSMATAMPMGITSTTMTIMTTVTVTATATIGTSHREGGRVLVR